MAFFQTENIKTTDFDAIRLRLASPETIRGWSYGEITKPETINYRTQKPEKGGLFAEEIFGPSKDWECYCGKYKKIRYKGIICDKCGVEVTHSLVRRERMGHIELCAPVAHIWFLRSVPSKIGTVLDITLGALEKVIYFTAFIITDVNEELRNATLEQVRAEYKGKRKSIEAEYERDVERFQKQAAEKQIKQQEAGKELDRIQGVKETKLKDLEEDFGTVEKELKDLETMTILSENDYHDLSLKYGHVFEAKIGAEAIDELLHKIDVAGTIKVLQADLEGASDAKHDRLIRRLKLLKSLNGTKLEPHWMILKALPVIPPDLRPMVALDGGRFAASDLNDLYRRVINRNNRLRKLMSIGAPEVICRNEKRMLQESVDTLLNNSARAGKTLFTAGDRRKLRSLSDMLKGKQGRFRQNLLGKRVDYSGRSVIVVGPHLKLDQCGLPKDMAMKLIKPLVIGRIIRDELAHNVKAAERLIQDSAKEVWDILEEVIKDRYVMLNRAPTLHRLGIQAFKPQLVEGLAIQLHPLVCTAFNADFDGDQMAVHVPLSDNAQNEAHTLMAASRNILKPSSGEPVINPVQDMVLGCYFLTQVHDGKKGEGMVFSGPDEAFLAYDHGVVDLQAKINVRMKVGEMEPTIIETSVGRLRFQEIVPPALGIVNKTMKKRTLSDLLAVCLEQLGPAETVALADRIKDIGFEAVTISGVSIAAEDMLVPAERGQLIDEANEKVKAINNHYWQGLMTADERYSHAIRVWAKAKNEISAVLVQEFLRYPENDITYVIDSGARGNWGQVTQLAGMKGLVANPSGRTIELPVQSNLKDGFSVLEYFIATHGGRKGKSDTALKTAEAGYLTRRLVDAVQDIIIREDDCLSMEEHLITRKDSERIGEKFEVRVFGRTLAADVKMDGKTIAKRNQEIDADLILELNKHKVPEVPVRSVMACRTRGGICMRCYGRDLSNNKSVQIGTPVGIIAAQSIGEPGTQLTMRTFHMGGVAEGADITQGLTRVEELFEARSPRTPATLSDITGRIKVSHQGGKTTVLVIAEEPGEDTYILPAGYQILVKKGDEVEERGIIAKSSTDKSVLKATIAGKVSHTERGIIRVRHRESQERTYEFGPRESLLVKSGAVVEAGQPLNAGHFNLQELLEKKGTYAVQNYVVQEVQHIYASQGQTINDKHLEIIVKKMFSKVRVIDAGDTNFLPGETADLGELLLENDRVRKVKGSEATFEQLLLGITRVALATDSWLAGASFQETIRVLVEAATTRRIDLLQGLKENVIIGRLIPTGEIYRNRFISQDAPAESE